MSRSRWVAWGLTLAVMGLAAGVRFHRLEAQSFWNDEGNSARLSERSLPLIIEGTASDIHPPLYYVILHGWRALAGASEFSLRAVSALAGAATVACLFPLTRRLYPPAVARPAGLMAAAGVALSPSLVYYSQEARMYAWLTFLATLATLLLLLWRRERRPGWGLAYALTLAAGLYTHYVFPVVIVGQAGLLGWLAVTEGAGRRPVGRAWVGWLALAGLLYLPWLPVLLGSLGGNRGAPQAWSAFVTGVGRFLWWGPVAELPALWLWLGAGVAAGLVWRWARPAAVIPLLALWPPAALALVQATDPAFYKLALPAVPWLWLTLAGGLAVAFQLPRRVLTRRLVWGVGGLALLVTGVGLAAAVRQLAVNPRYARDDYRGLAGRIAREAGPETGIILNAPNQWEVFTYYHTAGAPVYPLPRGRPEQAALEAELAEIAGRHTRLYVLFWGEQQQDPQGWVEGWLNRHTYRLDTTWVGNVRLVRYTIPPLAPDELTHPLDLQLGPAVVLRGYALTATTVQPGEALALTLFWEATAPVTARYKVFVHLAGPDGRPAAQQDSEPQGGLAPTDAWVAGTAVVDKYGLLIPPELPAGDYPLLVGLYRLDDPTQRLPITSPTGETGDAWPLLTLQVRPNRPPGE